jgi:hypothetical protein
MRARSEGKVVCAFTGVANVGVSTMTAMRSNANILAPYCTNLATWVPEDALQSENMPFTLSIQSDRKGNELFHDNYNINGQFNFSKVSTLFVYCLPERFRLL